MHSQSSEGWMLSCDQLQLCKLLLLYCPTPSKPGCYCHFLSQDEMWPTVKCGQFCLTFQSSNHVKDSHCKHLLGENYSIQARGVFGAGWDESHKDFNC